MQADLSEAVVKRGAKQGRGFSLGNLLIVAGHLDHTVRVEELVGEVGLQLRKGHRVRGGLVLVHLS